MQRDESNLAREMKAPSTSELAHDAITKSSTHAVEKI